VDDGAAGNMTIREALNWAVGELSAGGVEEPHQEAELLLRHYAGLPRAALYAPGDRPLSEAVWTAWQAAVAERRKRRPLAYVLGTWEFMGLEFQVDERVLVPRPETEVLVEEVLARLDRDRQPLTVVDVGTGCGAMAVSLAVSLPTARVWATDLSEDALTLARANAARLGVADRITFVAGDLLEPLAGWELWGRVDAFVANLPYIPSDVIDGLQPEVSRYEPRLALDGGPEGLAVLRRFLPQVPRYLADGGFAACEIGDGQAGRVVSLAEASGLRVEEVIRDFGGIERIVLLRRSEG